MISTDFAPNEDWKDAFVSFKTLLKPWTWQKGEELSYVKNKLLSFFPNSSIFLYLTGRAGLYQILKALSLETNAEVLVQAFTCEAVVLPILANNLKPVYVDIETETFSMDLKDLEKKITNNAKVLILQHTFGLTPVNRKKILELAKQHNLFMIEDLAHGFSSNLTIQQFGNSTILLSFGRSKALSSVFGGAVVTRDKFLINKFENAHHYISSPDNSFIFRTLLYKPLSLLIKSTYDFYLGKILHQLIKKLNLLPPEITQKEKKGEYDQLLNKAYPNALASLLLNQLNKFDDMQKQRERIAKYYHNQVKLKNVTCYMLRVTCSLLRYPVLINNREELITKVRKQNIFLGLWYDQAVAPKSLDLNRVGYRSGSCPQAEKICQKIINLPTNINEKEAERVVKILNDV